MRTAAFVVLCASCASLILVTLGAAKTSAQSQPEGLPVSTGNSCKIPPGGSAGGCLRWGEEYTLEEATPLVLASLDDVAEYSAWEWCDSFQLDLSYWTYLQVSAVSWSSAAESWWAYGRIDVQCSEAAGRPIPGPQP